MKLQTGARFALSCLVSFAAFLISADAQSGFISFDYPGARGTIPLALNESGIIGGYYTDANKVQHAFLQTRQGDFVNAEPPSASSSFITAVGNTGAAVGQYTDSQNGLHGYMRAPSGKYREIKIPGYFYTTPYGINDTNQVTGYAFDTHAHGFLWAPFGTVASFDVPGSSFTAPRAINASGTITGFYGNGNLTSSFIRNPDGSFVTFDAGSGTQTVTSASDINASGQAAGVFTDDTLRTFGFLRDTDGTITLFLGVGGFSVSSVTSINNLGYIVGASPQNLGEGAFQRDPAGNVDYIPIPFPNGTSGASEINNRGHVSGYYVGQDLRFHGWAE